MRILYTHFFFCLRLYNLESLDDCAVEELIHDIEPPAPDDKVDDTAFVIIDDPATALSDRPCLAYQSCLLRLAPQMDCTECGQQCDITVRHMGSAFILVLVRHCFLLVCYL